VDLESGRVWVAGSPRTRARWGQLTQWGVAQIARYLKELPEEPETPIIGGGTPGSALAQSSAVGVIAQTLRRAGLAEAPDVRPSSVAAWAGRKVFDETGRVDVAAQQLGIRSLDRAARFIGWDWAPEGG
jgi:integrase/recombinase XerC